MFETEDFEKKLQEAVANAAGTGGVDKYQTAIFQRLLQLARENETQLLQEEMQKSASLRRGLNDAYASARTVVLAASQKAASQSREVVTLDDFNEAYQARFCTLWPFCKKP